MCTFVNMCNNKYVIKFRMKWEGSLFYNLCVTIIFTTIINFVGIVRNLSRKYILLYLYTSIVKYFNMHVTYIRIFVSTGLYLLQIKILAFLKQWQRGKGLWRVILLISYFFNNGSYFLIIKNYILICLTFVFVYFQMSSWKYRWK